MPLIRIFQKSGKKINTILKAEKEHGPRSLICILNLWLAGKENDRLEGIPSPRPRLPSRVGLEGADAGAKSSQLRKAGFGGAEQGSAVLSVRRHSLSPDGRIRTKALIIWLIKAGSILPKLEPAAEMKPLVSSPSFPS